MRRLLLLTVLTGLLLAGGGAWWGYVWYGTPGPLEMPTTVVLPKGERLDALADRLAAAGVIDHPKALVLVGRLTRFLGDTRAGEYLFPARSSPAQVLSLLRSGKTVVHRLVVPEGLSTAEALALVERADALDGAVSDPPGEGQLMPDTYFYAWGDKRQSLVDRMRRARARLLEQLWAARAEGVALNDPAEAVTLASIVEKETALAAERPKVAGLFYNRLRLGMKLQSDPTVIYAVTGGAHPLGRKLTRTDLETDSPYNTYVVTGLPPGPIDNPGRAALEAVLQPQATDALYFVADGSGGHAFAATLEQHNQNVARWRKLEGHGGP